MDFKLPFFLLNISYFAQVLFRHQYYSLKQFIPYILAFYARRRREDEYNYIYIVYIRGLCRLRVVEFGATVLGDVVYCFRHRLPIYIYTFSNTKQIYSACTYNMLQYMHSVQMGFCIFICAVKGIGHCCYMIVRVRKYTTTKMYSFHAHDVASGYRSAFRKPG